MRRRGLLLWAALPAGALAQGQPQQQRDLDVNTATRAELESLPGVGPALAQRLLTGRPFADWPDLMRRVSGVKAATARRLSAAGLRVDGRGFD